MLLDSYVENKRGMKPRAISFYLSLFLLAVGFIILFFNIAQGKAQSIVFVIIASLLFVLAAGLLGLFIYFQTEKLLLEKDKLVKKYFFFKKEEVIENKEVHINTHKMPLLGMVATISVGKIKYSYILGKPKDYKQGELEFEHDIVLKLNEAKAILNK